MSAQNETTPSLQKLEGCLAGIAPPVRTILEDCLQGRDLTWENGVVLSEVTGPELHALCLCADSLRQRQAGDVVTYVVNRNINFTNVCVKACRFCAFSRAARSQEGYFLE